MRKIFYPLFLFALTAGVYHFFGDGFSPLMQKIILVLGIAFAFFLFRGIFLFFFDWIFESFSSLFKTIISGILFLVLGVGFLASGAFPSHLKEKTNTLLGNTSSFFDSKNTKAEIAEQRRKAEEGKEGVEWEAAKDENGEIILANTVSSEETARTPKHLLKNIKIVEKTTEVKKEKTQETSNNTEASEKIDTENSEARTWKKPVITYMNPLGNSNTEKKSEKTEVKIETSEKSGAVVSVKTEGVSITVNKTSETSEKQSSTGVVEKSDKKADKEANNKEKTVEENNVESAEKTNSKIAKMKQSGVRLVSSGPLKEDYTVVFREIDAQVVFPVEYTVSNVIWTDKDSTLDTVDFSVLTPKNENAEISISLSDSGIAYDTLFAQFEKSNNSENKFFAKKISENTMVYSTFFEGILWEISITLPEKNATEEDFYSIILPISFEKKD